MQVYWAPIKGNHGYAAAATAVTTPDNPTAKGATPDSGNKGAFQR